MHGSLKRLIKSDDIETGAVTPVKQAVITQDGTFAPGLGSTYRAFPVAFSVAPRGVQVTPGPAAGNANHRVVRITTGSFAAIGTPGGKTHYFSAKGSR